MQTLRNSDGSPKKSGWLLREGAIETLIVLIEKFRARALSQLPVEFSNLEYLPWMDSYLEHGDTTLFRQHETQEQLLVDRWILPRLENVFSRNGNPLGFLLQEEKSFRILRDVIGRNYHAFFESSLFQFTPPEWIFALEVWGSVHFGLAEPSS